MLKEGGRGPIRETWWETTRGGIEGRRERRRLMTRFARVAPALASCMEGLCVRGSGAGVRV